MRRQRPKDRRGRARLVELRSILRHPNTTRPTREAALQEIETLAPVLPKFVRRPLDSDTNEAFETLADESVGRAVRFYLSSPLSEQQRMRTVAGMAFGADFLKWLSVEHWHRESGEISLLGAL